MNNDLSSLFIERSITNNGNTASGGYCDLITNCPIINNYTPFNIREINFSGNNSLRVGTKRLYLSAPGSNYITRLAVNGNANTSFTVVITVTYIKSNSIDIID